LKNSRSILTAVFASVLFCIVSGCASFEKNIDTEKLLTQIAVMKVVEVGETAQARHERAVRIVAFASDARTLINVESFSIDDLKANLILRVGKLDLVPSDQILAGILIDQVIGNLRERTAGNVNLPIASDQIKYQVNTVLAWVEGAAGLY
jgi:hypothetical protein